MKVSDYKYHQLEEGLSYMSCHIEEGQSLIVVTTPIAHKTFDEHEVVLEKKLGLGLKPASSADRDDWIKKDLK